MTGDAEVREQKRIGGVMQALAWLVFIGLGLYYFSDLLDRQNNPNREVATHYDAEGRPEVILNRNRHGHYVATGRINGMEVTFLVDTGATGVAIPAAVAERLGLRRGLPMQTQTANGISTSYAVTLASVSIGAIELQEVPAAIAPGLRMNEVLLGMSFLKHVEFSQRGDTLLLRQ